MMDMWHRLDLTLVNSAQNGASLRMQLEGCDYGAARQLTMATGPKVVFIMGGYNDVRLDRAAVPVIYGYYQAAGTMARASGAKVICGLDVVRQDGSHKQTAAVLEVSSLLRASPGFCDAFVDFQTNELFAREEGPYPITPFATNRVHLDNEGQKIMAQMAIPIFKRILN